MSPLISDENAQKLVRAYLRKRWRILSEMARAKAANPDLPTWPVWDPA